MLRLNLFGSVFDGLEIPLESLAQEHGFFLTHGVEVDALDMSRQWRLPRDQRLAHQRVVNAAHRHCVQYLIDAVKSIIALGALPFVFIVLLLLMCLLKALRKDVTP